MHSTSTQNHACIKIYNGYGHAKNLFIFGHVLQSAFPLRKEDDGLLQNIRHLFNLFRLQPLAGVQLKVFWGNKVIDTVSQHDGFFKAEWESEQDTEAGWHEVIVRAYDADNKCINESTGRLFIPHITQFAFISDIDDTILVSYSSTIFRRLRTLFTKNPATRKTFDDTALHYQLLARSFTEPEVRNPFFYVSSSEWNLYDDLQSFLLHKQMPEGVLLLSQLKLLKQLIKTGKTKHEGKLLRIVRVLIAFPNQQFILSGDNSQKDPEIYKQIAEKYSSNIYAVYIRNVSKHNAPATLKILEEIKALGIHTCQYKNSAEAIEHSKKTGLIQ